MIYKGPEVIYQSMFLCVYSLKYANYFHTNYKLKEFFGYKKIDTFANVERQANVELKASVTKCLFI